MAETIDDDYQEYLDSIGGESAGSYTPDLESIDTTKKVAYGAEQEESCCRNQSQRQT